MVCPTVPPAECEELVAAMAAAGKKAALGPLDECMSDDGDEEEEDEDASGDDFGLSAALAKAGL